MKKRTYPFRIATRIVLGIHAASPLLFKQTQNHKPKTKHPTPERKTEQNRAPKSQFCNTTQNSEEKRAREEEEEEQSLLKMGEGEVVLFVDDFSKITYCRICFEAEFESSQKLEAPCACSGTVKFAHRECIQRWCNEKGDTVCEICLQKYEPGYTTIPKQPKKMIVHDEVVNIRESAEVLRHEYELQNEELSTMNEYSSDLDRSASCCKTLALIFTFLLLTRHLLDIWSGGAGHYPFSIFTVLLLKTCGIIVPMFIIIRTITTLQNSVRRYRNLHDSLIPNANSGNGHWEQVDNRDNADMDV